MDFFNTGKTQIVIKESVSSNAKFLNLGVLQGPIPRYMLFTLYPAQIGDMMYASTYILTIISISQDQAHVLMSLKVSILSIVEQL